MALERPDISQLGDSYQLTWPITGVQIVFDRLVETREGLFSEATFARYVPGQAPRLLLDTRFNLLSATTKAQVVKTLAGQLEEVDWANVLETGCFLVKRRQREGDPAVDLALLPPSDRPRWVLRPYLSADRPAIIFGAGGGGKTMFALAAAVSCASGHPIVGQPVGPPRRVQILDYESDHYEHQARVRAICRGAGLPPLAPNCLYHRRMPVTLAAAAPTIRREIATLGIGLVLIDSLAGAAGELEESAAILQCFAAIRSLGVPVLVISHITRASIQADELANGRRRLSPFGSVFAENSAGNTWSLRRRGEEGAGSGSLLLVHEKTNNDRYHPRHAYRVSFLRDSPTSEEEDGELLAVTYRREDYGDAFEDHLPLTQKLLRLLDKDGPKTSQELLGLLPELKPTTVRATISNLKEAGRIVQLQDRRYAVGAPEREPAGDASGT